MMMNCIYPLLRGALCQHYEELWVQPAQFYALLFNHSILIIALITPFAGFNQLMKLSFTSANDTL